MRRNTEKDNSLEYTRTVKRAQERIHLSVQFDMEETEWYGYGAAGVLGLGVRNNGFNQPVAAYAAGKERTFSGKGVNRGVAFVMLIALTALLAALVFTNLFALTETGGRVTKLETELQTQMQCVQDLKQQLSDAQKDCDIAYLAPQLGMHRETAKDTVYLTVNE